VKLGLDRENVAITADQRVSLGNCSEHQKNHIIGITNLRQSFGRGLDLDGFNERQEFRQQRLLLVVTQLELRVGKDT